MSDLKDVRLKAFVKDKTKEILLQVGRKLVVEKGIDALSARKLATAANSSVGMVYNVFGTMDNYIAEQNLITLNELYKKMESVVLSKNPFSGAPGLLTYNNIKKASYNAYVLFSKLGDKLLKKSNNYSVTLKDNNIVILINNYNHYADLYADSQYFPYG